MTLAATSREAYATIREKLGQKQQIVYDTLKDYPDGLTNEQLSGVLGWPINRITGRTNELNKFGMIAVNGLRPGKSGISAKVWVVKDMNDAKLRQIEEPPRAISWLNDADECAA